MKDSEIQDLRPRDDESRRTVDRQARPTSSHSVPDQPQNGSSIIGQTGMGMRGKDRIKGRQHNSSSDRPVEEGVLVTTRSSSDDGSHKGKKKKTKSFRRSRGVLLFTVFMALLLDETLMTIIVPVLPDYFLNLCIGDKCVDINNSSECDSILQNTSPDDNILSTWTTPDQQDVEVSATSNPEYFITSITSTTTEADTSTPADTPDSSSLEAPSFEEICTVEITPKIGILFASKFILRIILSPFIGTFAHKIGFSTLLLSGCAIMLVSSLVFAFGISYEVMLTARIVHGLGATLNEIGGLGILAYKYRNDEKRRGFAFGLAIGGFAAGTLIGPPLGGITYDFLGKESPFFIMAGFFAALGVLELIVFIPHSKRQIYTKGSPVYKLILDPYILGTAGALMVASGVVALLEPTLPIWMRHNIKPTPDAWQLGAVFLPSGISYIISSTSMGYLGYKLGRWALSLFALVVLATSVAAVPYTSSFLMLVGPMVGIGFGFGTVDSAMTAMLNSRVDARHEGAYGGAAAISTFAFCLGFAIGPSVSGFLTNAFGFKWLMRGIGVITFLYAPICIFLRRPGNIAQNTRNNNNGYSSRSHNDVIDDAESIPIPSISRRLSRV